MQFLETIFLSKGKDSCFFVSVAVSLYLGELQTKSISTKALVQ